MMPRRAIYAADATMLLRRYAASCFAYDTLF